MSAPPPPPPSMPAGGHEMQEYYSNQDPPRSAPHTAPSITPYLGLRARLSQVWINRWTILLLLVLARSLIAISGVNNDLASARREALSACSDVESMGSAMASLPHYMSQGVNELTATGVEKSVNGLMSMTTLSVTAVEEIAVFVIGMMTNTYLCLITFAVGGSLHSAIDVISSSQANLNQQTAKLGTDMSGIVTKFLNEYNSALNLAKGVQAGLGLSLPAPSDIDLTSQINQLQNLKLPSSLDADLQSLNNSIPNFAQVKNFTDNLIRTPFEDVKSLISTSLGNYTFDRSLLPIPEKQQLTFCSDDNGINEFFDKLVGLAAFAKKMFVSVLLTAAVLVMIPMAYREIRRWRMMQGRAHLVGAGERDPMDVVYLVSRPYTSSAGIKVAHNLESARRQTLVRWVIAYATSDAALFVLALGIAGLFSCACQTILLKSLQKEVPSLTNQVSGFADKIVAQLNNASEHWATGTNDAIASVNQEINDNMLGWVNTTTTAVNETLNTFVSMTTDVLNTTFGGTPLYDPVLEVLNCLVLLKVAGIEKALTWVHDNAHVDFPSLPKDTFSVGAVASIASDNATPSDSFLSSPGDTTSDKISTTVARFVARLEDAIRTEAIISTIILLIWLLIVFIGVGRALMLWYGRDKPRGEGGAPAVAALDKDFRTDDQDRYASQFSEIPLGTVNNVRPFTPAPRYTEAKDVGPVSSEVHGRGDYDDRNFGFAGQREYEHSVVGRRAAQSVRGSIWESDTKL